MGIGLLAVVYARRLVLVRAPVLVGAAWSRPPFLQLSHATPSERWPPVGVLRRSVLLDRRDRSTAPCGGSGGCRCPPCWRALLGRQVAKRRRTPVAPSSWPSPRRGGRWRSPWLAMAARSERLRHGQAIQLGLWSSASAPPSVVAGLAPRSLAWSGRTHGRLVRGGAGWRSLARMAARNTARSPGRSLLAVALVGSGLLRAGERGCREPSSTTGHSEGDPGRDSGNRRIRPGRRVGRSRSATTSTDRDGLVRARLPRARRPT